MNSQLATLTVTGRPIPKARPRVGARGGHTPEPTATYEATVGWMARTAMRGRKPSIARVGVVIDLYGSPSTTQADVDNIAKSLLDGMEGIVYANDRQVDDLHIRRHLDTPDPRAVVVVRELTQSEATR